MFKTDFPFKHHKRYHAVFCTQYDSPQVVKNIKRFRKQLFVDQYNWNLPVTDDFEQDQFDLPYTIYCALYYGSELVGTFRAIQTDCPYLTQTLFHKHSDLCVLPKSRECWEISRFGVRPENNTRHGQIKQHAIVNYAAMFYFAHQINAKKLIATTDTTYERFLSLLGIRTRRYGPPQIIGTDRFGKPLSGIAGEIPLAAQTGPKYQKILNLIQQIDVTDATHIFGLEQISA
ncbi:MAG: acyl-homoserine-lactone synthase [Pseudomonadota bacterium]